MKPKRTTKNPPKNPPAEALQKKRPRRTTRRAWLAKQRTVAPNPPRFNDADERVLTQAERLHIRAEILVIGVSESLKNGHYCGVDAIEESAEVLKDAAGMRRHAFRLQDSVKAADGKAFNHNLNANPRRRR